MVKLYNTICCVLSKKVIYKKQHLLYIFTKGEKQQKKEPFKKALLFLKIEVLNIGVFITGLKSLSYFTGWGYLKPCTNNICFFIVFVKF